VEYVSLNSVYIKKFELGRGLKIGEIRINFFLDRLIIYREVESVEISEVYFDLNRFREDFEREGGGKRKKPNLTKFSIKRVLVHDLNVKLEDGSGLWVFRSSFSFHMWRGGITLKDININSADFPTMLFLNEALGSINFDFDTLRLFFVDLSGNVDTFGLRLKNLSVKIPTISDTLMQFIQFSRADMGNMGAKNSRLKWIFTDKGGKIEFMADSIWYSQISSKDISGTVDLQSIPEVFVTASGKIFDGNFEASVFVDSLQNVLGSVKFFGISPSPNVELTGKANFEVEKENIRVFGFISNFINQEPYFVLDNFKFDVKSRDFKVYSYRVYSELMNIEGWYDQPTEDFYAKFSLSKPTRLVRFQDVRVFTFEGEGEVSKRGNEVSLWVDKGKAWYTVIDTFRIDELEAENLHLKTNIYNPNLKNTFLSGRIFLKTTHPDTFSVIGDISFDEGKILAGAYLETIKFGRAYAKIRGNILDTNFVDITFDTLNYGFNDISLKFRNLRVFLDTLRMGIYIPKNELLNGSLEGEAFINRKNDSIYGKFMGERLSIIKLLPYINPKGDLYIDTVDVVINLRGTSSDPNLYGKLKTQSLMYLQYPFDSSEFNFEISKDRITLEDSKIWSKDTPLNVEVFKLFFENSIIYGHITSRSWNTDEILFFLAPESSRADIDLWLSGKLENPNILGNILWYAKKVEINGNTIEKPKISLMFDGERIFFNDVVLKLGGGYVNISGKIRTNGDIDSLGILLMEVYLNLDPEISARLSGNLEISGNVFNAVMVRGEIFSQELYFSKPLSYFATPPTPSEQKPIILYDIHFYAPRRLFVNSPIYSQFFTGAVVELDAEMSADITLQKLSPTSAINYGYLEILRGNVFVLDKVFNIESGRIELYGIDGNVNLTSSSTMLRSSEDTLQGYDSVKVFVNITGSLLNPKVEFWSQPYMGTAEILSLVLGGQAGLISALIGTGLRRGLRVQELNVKNTGDISQLIFGTYLGRNVYIRYFSNRIGQSEYNSIRTQYFLKNNISIYGERIEENGEVKFGTGINLRFRF